MLDELRDRITAYISEHRTCVISTSGNAGAAVTPAWHYHRGLELMCLLPRWSDAFYVLEQDPSVTVIILDAQSRALRWLQYRGRAKVIQPPDLDQALPAGIPECQADGRYAAIRVSPERIDLIDESRGWGARETLDL